jgi:hypothetical protein
MLMRNSRHNIGNRTRDLPGCSAVSQPAALPHASSEYVSICMYVSAFICFFGIGLDFAMGKFPKKYLNLL